MSKHMWNERFAEDGYAYGEAPNAFLASSLPYIPRGTVLCLAEGQGRNAVFLAESGYAVTAVDWSEEGMAKARMLADRRGVSIATVVADLSEYDITPGTWCGVVSVFAHLPSALRKQVHRKIVAGLSPGGVVVLEAYTPEQLAYGTGGPKDPDLLMTKTGLVSEFHGLEILHAIEIVRDVTEGKYHTGKAAVVQLIARKPAILSR